MYSFGKRLKKIRRQKGLSQKELAACINAKNSTVSNWEQGTARPDVDMLAVICNALDVSADELLDIKLLSQTYSAVERQIIEKYKKKHLCNLQFESFSDWMKHRTINYFYRCYSLFCQSPI